MRPSFLFRYRRFILKTPRFPVLLATLLALWGATTAYAGWNTPITVDSAGDVGLYTSLAVVNGHPAISYRDITNGDLKYVQAVDADGSSWGSPVTVDSAGDVGAFASLAVVNGYPAISYFDLTNIDLKYVRATNAGGSSWGSPVTLGSAGDVGGDTSLAVVNGYPAISYYDFTNGGLKYVSYTPVPEMAVLGNGTEITDGDTTPSPTDHTDFDSVMVSQSLTRTFTISNSGELDLYISSLSLSGAAAADFSLSGLAIPAIVGPGATATFDVRFMPSAVGSRAATISIANDDSNKNPYDFAIRGTGTLLFVTLSVSAGSGTEADQTVITVSATASANVAGTQTVDLGVSGANITSGDYSLSNATITIPDGQSSGSVTFTIQDDALDEDTETATLTLSNPSAGITLGSPISQDVTITDNDTAGILVSPTSLSVTEPDGSGSFTVTLASQPAATVTIDLVSGDQACAVQTLPATSSDGSYHQLDGEDVTVMVIDTRRYVYLPLILRP